MLFLNLEYGTVKRERENEHTNVKRKARRRPRRTATKKDQKARCNGQGPTTRTAKKGEPGHRPKERRGGRKRRNGDDDGNDDEDDGNENERPDREREKGEKKRRERKGKREATTTQPQQAQPDSIRTIQNAQKPLTPPK